MLHCCFAETVLSSRFSSNTFVLATADRWSKPSHQRVSVAVRSLIPSNSSLSDEIGSSNGSGPFRNPERPSWLALQEKLHHKFAVIDNRTVITGSFNWSPSAAHQNDEALLVIESPLLAAHFTREMDRLWRGRYWGSMSDWHASWRQPLGAAAVGCGGGEWGYAAWVVA